MAETTKNNQAPTHQIVTPNQSRTPVAKPRYRKKIHKVVYSIYFRIIFSAILIFLLFVTAFTIAYQSETRKKANIDYEKEIPDAEILLPTPELTANLPPDEDLRSWITYNNQDYQFSVQHPSNWQAYYADINTDANNPVWNYLSLRDNELSKVQFRETGEYLTVQGSFEINVLKNPQEYDTQEWAENYRRPLAVDPSTNLASPSGEVLIDNIKAKEFSVFAFDSTETAIGLVKNNYIYTFRFTSEIPDFPEIEKHNKIYNQILSTFEFLE